MGEAYNQLSERDKCIVDEHVKGSLESKEWKGLLSQVPEAERGSFVDQVREVVVKTIMGNLRSQYETEIQQGKPDQCQRQLGGNKGKGI